MIPCMGKFIFAALNIVLLMSAIAAFIRWLLS